MTKLRLEPDFTHFTQSSFTKHITISADNKLPATNNKKPNQLTSLNVDIHFSFLANIQAVFEVKTFIICAFHLFPSETS